MIPEFRKSKKVIEDSQAKFFNFKLKEQLGVPFGNIERRPLQEGNRIKQNYLNDLERNVEMTKIDSKFELYRDQIKENPYIIYDQLAQSAREFATQEAQMIISNVDEITKLTGNVVESQGQLTIEHFYQVLEKVEIPFDNEGKPIMPMIMGGPDFLKRLMEVFTNDEKINKDNGRMNKLIEKKRKLWYDRENNRKLVD